MPTALHRTILVLTEEGEVWHFAHDEQDRAICLYYQQNLGHYEYLAGEVEQELRQWSVQHRGPADRRAARGGPGSLCLSDFESPATKKAKSTSKSVSSLALTDFVDQSSQV